jgi:putative transcriptional regulator
MMPKVMPVTPGQIRAIRERANMSQAVFARYLNLTAGYVSQLERGSKQPTGAALETLACIYRSAYMTLFKSAFNIARNPAPY